jgi:hypothetical protein
LYLLNTHNSISEKKLYKFHEGYFSLFSTIILNFLAYD